jgi:REP element-mobilizing transposase RayT
MENIKTPFKQTLLPETLSIADPVLSKMTSQFNPRRTHGGVPSLQKRKTTRPFSPGAPIHLVLSSERAKATWSLLHRKNRAKVNAMIYVYAKRFQVKVYRAENIGNQLHLLIKAQEKKQLADYLRVLAGRVAVVVTGAQKLVKKIGRFWDYLYWSRLVNWGQDFFQTRKWVMSANELVSDSTSIRHGFVSDWQKTAKPG